MKQLLILLIVIFCVLSAYILRLSNHIRFRLLGSRLLFLIRRHIILVVDLFQNGIRTFYSVQESIGCDTRLISSINCILAYKTVLQAHRASTAFLDLVPRATISVV